MLGDLSGSFIRPPRPCGIRPEDRRRGHRDLRRDQQHRQRLAVDVRQRLDTFAPAGDERHAPRQEERHIGTQRRSQRSHRVRVEGRAPHGQGGLDGRRRVAAATAKTRGHGDSFGQSRRERRRVCRSAGPRRGNDFTGRGDCPQDQVVGRRGERQSCDPQRITHGARWRRRCRQSVAKGERNHDRMESVITVFPPADHGQGQVQLGRREADDVDARAGGSLGGHRPMPSRRGPMATRSASHSSTESV